MLLTKLVKIVKVSKIFKKRYSHLSNVFKSIECLTQGWIDDPVEDWNEQENLENKKNLSLKRNHVFWFSTFHSYNVNHTQNTARITLILP